MKFRYARPRDPGYSTSHGLGLILPHVMRGLCNAETLRKYRLTNQYQSLTILWQKTEEKLMFYGRKEKYLRTAKETFKVYG